MKPIEEKVTNKFVTKDRIAENIKKINTTTTGMVMSLADIPQVGEWVFNDILESELYPILDMVGQRDFNFVKLRHEIDKKVAEHLKKLNILSLL